MIIKRSLPDRVFEIVPEAKKYEPLLEQEHKIDQLINRYKFSMVEKLRKGQSLRSDAKYEISVITNVRKLSSSNESSALLNHPQRELFCPSTSDSKQFPVYWDVRIEGKLVDGYENEVTAAESSHKIFNHINRLYVETDKNIYASNNVLIDWKKDAKNQIEVFKNFRFGLPTDLKIGIHLEVNTVPVKFRLHPKLAALFGVDYCTKNEVVTQAWNYISRNKLQDPLDTRMIKFDRHLSDLMGVQSISITELIPSFNKFLLKCEPIYFEHVIDASNLQGVIENDQVLTSKTSKIIDITIDNCYADHIKEYLIKIKQNAVLEKLDKQINSVLESLRLSARANQFYEEFAKSPVSFFREWLAAQQSDLNVMEDGVEDVGLGRENHHAETYLAREDMLNDASYFGKPWVPEAIKQYVSDLYTYKHKPNPSQNAQK